MQRDKIHQENKKKKIETEQEKRETHSMLLVSRIAFLYASLLATWSTCVSFMWNVKVWAPPLCFFSVSVVLFSIHVVGHFPIWKHWYQAHTLGHHVVAHPVQRFTAPLYSTNVLDRYGLNRWLYIAAGSVTALGSWFWLTEQRLVDLISLLVLPGIGMWFEEFIHREIHIQKSSLERFDWFLELREYHRLHHLHKLCNFAAVGLYMDYLLQTLRHPVVRGTKSADLPLNKQ